MLRVIQQLQSLKNSDHHDRIDGYERFIGKYLEESMENEEFYNLPIENICSIIRHSNLSKDTSTGIRLLKRIIRTLISNDEQKSRVPMLLNAIDLPEASEEDCISILSDLVSSPLCIHLGNLVLNKEKKDEESSQVRDLMNSLAQKDEIIQQLRAQLSSFDIHNIDAPNAAEDQEEQSNYPNIEAIEEPEAPRIEEQRIEPEVIATEQNHPEVVVHRVRTVRKPFFFESNIFAATRKGKLSSVQYLIEGGTDVNIRDEEGRSPMYIAASEGQYEIANYLIGEGADRNLKSNNGNTPLIAAATKNNLRLVRLLTEWSALIEEKNNLGGTALMAAAENGSLDVVKHLCENCHANVDSQQNQGSTPLIIASLNGFLNVVKYLCEFGANVNIANNEGKTALFYASCFDHYDIAKTLIQFGADKKKKTNEGETAYDVADDDNDQMRKLLK